MFRTRIQAYIILVVCSLFLGGIGFTPVSAQVATPAVTASPVSVQTQIQSLLKLLLNLQQQLLALKQSELANQVVNPSLTITAPKAGDALFAGQGKDVDFRVTWTAQNISGNASVYFTASDGSTCLIGTAPIAQGYFALEHGKYVCQNTPALLVPGVYTVSVESDTLTASGKNVNATIGGTVTLTVVQPAPLLTTISPTTATGKTVDLLDIYGTNITSMTNGKGGVLYVDILKNNVRQMRLSSTDVPMTVFAGVYVTPQDFTAGHIQVRVDTSKLSSGTYQVQVTTDSGSSNTLPFTVK